MAIIRSIQRLVERIIHFGTDVYPEPIARRLRLANMLNGYTFISNLVFSLGFAITHWEVLYPQSIASAVTALFWLATPFFHRVHETAAAIYYCIGNTLAFLFFAYLDGAAFGGHYFLLAVPAVMLFLGSRHVLVGLTLFILVIGSFIWVELWFPHSALIVPIPATIATVNKAICVVSASLVIFGSIYYALRFGEQAESLLEREYARSEALLHNLMPDSIAIRLKNNPESIIADQFDSVTILFADIVGFTPRARRLAPNDLVSFLNRVFSEFDRLAETHGLEKIKTIGDAYMVAGGMPERREGHAAAIANMALDMLAVTERLGSELHDDLAVRIGIHTGPAVAGVIGTRKLFYDVWGDTVNTASRMESHGSAGRIQVTFEAKQAIGDAFVFDRRPAVEIKGKGPMRLYHLVGKAQRG